MDYYSILGVSKDATQDDVKKAYRKLAMKHHPDRGGDAAELQKINEAYSVLGDADKRSQYDNPQSRFDTSFMNGAGMHDFEDIFAQAFGRRQARQRRNRDITIVVSLDLEDVLTGKQLTSRYRLHSGRTNEANIDIPAGVDHGVGIRYQSLGDDSISHLPAGDLIVKVKIKKHPVWEKQNKDLYTTMTLDVFDCMLGTSLQIDTIEGKKLQLNIPKGTQTNTVFSIPNHGLPDMRSGTKGNAYIKIATVIPNIKNDTVLRKIADIKNEIS